MGKKKAHLGHVTDMDIRLLRVFQTVVESGGLSAAEMTLGIGRSTISTYLSDLETRLGFRLCSRGRGGFSLTDRGRSVYQSTQTLMASIVSFQSDLSHLHTDVRGPLSVAMVDNLIWDQNFRIVNIFRSIAPLLKDVDLQLHVLSPQDVERAVMDGTAEVGITPSVSESRNLNRKKIFTEDSLLYCSEDHTFFPMKDSEITAAMLKSCRYVRKIHMTDKMFNETNSAFSQQVVSENVESIAIMILTGQYIGFLPEDYASLWTKTGKMRAILPSKFRAHFDFCVITNKTRPASSVQQLFVDHFVREINDE
ncbi:hypothetical protein BFX83_07925 [Komagataeibacter xylinus]|nr:hypothetical protein BFX83_07925 [Komagataeibacter xylinus]